ncbi:hypothetical protein ABEF95_003691 [Exophiala dermatitidis]
MASANQGRNGLAQKLDTSYTSFSSTEGMRSPRTPTYIPESSSTTMLMPFDHAEFLLDKVTSKPARRLAAPPPPGLPSAWIWTCHLCHSRYPLGVTRRCLVDGHYYCSGETDRPSLRKRKKPKSCTSEFDYHSWKQWGDWRRKVLQSMDNPRSLKGCDFCDYPSQCRSLSEASPFGELLTSAGVGSEASSVSGSELSEREQRQNRVGGTTSKQTVDHETILNDVSSSNKKTKGKSGKSTTSRSTRSAKDTNQASSRQELVIGSQPLLIPSLQEEMAKETARLRELIGLDVWGDLQEMEAEKAKVE